MRWRVWSSWVSPPRTLFVRCMVMAKEAESEVTLCCYPSVMLLVWLHRSLLMEQHINAFIFMQDGAGNSPQRGRAFSFKEHDGDWNHTTGEESSRWWKGGTVAQGPGRLPPSSCPCFSPPFHLPMIRNYHLVAWINLSKVVTIIWSHALIHKCRDVDSLLSSKNLFLIQEIQLPLGQKWTTYLEHAWLKQVKKWG